MTEHLLIHSARVIDGTGAAPVDARDVLITDGRIAEIAPTGSIRHEDLPTLDAAGLTLLPGFFDCHVHLTTSPGEDELESIVEAESAKTLRAVPHLRDHLRSGVTQVRDLAGADSGFHDAVARGVVSGPDIQFALRILSVTGGHGDSRTIGGTPLDVGPSAAALADNPGGFVALTRETIRQGAQWIKVAATGGMGTPTSSPEGGGLSEPELRAVVEEARRHSVVGVAAHAIGAVGIAAAVRAGVRSIEHGYLIDDDTIERMLERGTFLVPTLSTLLRDLPASATPEQRDRRARTVDRARPRVEAALRAGVRVALGTDAGITAHGTSLRELALLVELGLSPMAAIVAGTSAAADLCGLAAEVGAVRVGLRADLVLTDADPLADIAALVDAARIRHVLKNGRVTPE